MAQATTATAVNKLKGHPITGWLFFCLPVFYEFGPTFAKIRTETEDSFGDYKKEFVKARNNQILLS